MQVTEEVMRMVRNALESLDYGEIRLSVAEKGSFLELQIIERFHVSKDSLNILESMPKRV